MDIYVYKRKKISQKGEKIFQKDDIKCYYHYIIKLRRELYGD